MKTVYLFFSVLFFVSASCYASLQTREYNIWYEKEAVLYDITQTAGGDPVMISISQAGFKSANLVISFMTAGQCSGQAQRLEINNDVVPAAYRCVQSGAQKIEHYSVRDADKVNALVSHLQSDFTLQIQGSIKVWAANIKTPKYGMTPRF